MNDFINNLIDNFKKVQEEDPHTKLSNLISAFHCGVPLFDEEVGVLFYRGYSIDVFETNQQNKYVLNLDYVEIMEEDDRIGLYEGVWSIAECGNDHPLKFLSSPLLDKHFEQGFIDKLDTFIDDGGFADLYESDDPHVDDIGEDEDNE